MASEAVQAVLQVMDCHPTSEVILTQACLVLGNIGRTGEKVEVRGGGGGEGGAKVTFEYRPMSLKGPLFV